MGEKLQSLISFLLGAGMAVACIVFYISASPKSESWPQISCWRNDNKMNYSSKEINGTELAEINELKEYKELSYLLKSASMDDNMVIITSLSEAWARPGSLLDLFLESFKAGEQIEHLLSHLVIVVMDPKAFKRCKEVHSYCYFLETKGINYTNEKVYMTKDYLEMMWGRNLFQQKILELGYNFLFTDVDIMWFRNPLRHIAITSHIAIASDFFFGDEDSLTNAPNGGFLYVRSCNKTIEFYKNWHSARNDFPGKHEQFVFNEIKRNFTDRFGVKIQFLNTAHCGGFCQLSKDFNKGNDTDTVTVEYSSSKAIAGDFIAVFSPAKLMNPYALILMAKSNRHFCAHAAPIKFRWANYSSDYVSSGKGSLKFQLINQREDFAIALFTGGMSKPVLVAVSNTISFVNPKAPVYPRLALGKSWNEMTVTWTSGYDISEAVPFVEWGTWGSPATRTPAGTLTFTRKSMCGAPARTVGWRDPGYIHTGFLKELWPNKMYDLLTFHFLHLKENNRYACVVC